MKDNSLKILIKNFPKGIFYASEAQEIGVSRRVLSYLVARGHITRLRRGVYELNEPSQGLYEGKDIAFYDLAKCARSLSPKAFISHISALEYWGLTNEFSRGFHISFPNNFSLPEDEQIIGYRPVDTRTGVVKRKIAGFTVRISSKERAIVEAFKKFDRDTGVEALRLYFEKKDPKIEQLLRVARKLDCPKLFKYIRSLYIHHTTDNPKVSTKQIEKMIQKEYI